MLTINNKELRNLEEQVLKNKQDIAKHYEIDRTLANFGIKIVGTVATVNDLPNPLFYEGEYGDGYAVGDPGSYTYYIFTRPDPNAGINENHWLDVGQLAIQGPQGPEGPQGPKGETGQSTKWFTNQITADDNAKPGDLLLEKNGDVFQYSDKLSQWVLITNIKGAQGLQGPRGIQGIQGEQGEQGPKGDTGDVGGFINIAGILPPNAILPDPATLNNLTIAYLKGNTKPYTLWIQVGSTSDTAVWQDMGPLNVATYVTVNGQFQNVWNADTKVNKITDAYRIYGTDKNGEQRSYKFSSGNLHDTIMFRNINSTCDIADPIEPLNIANKQYVDDGLRGKLDRATNVSEILYGTDENGDTSYWNFDSAATGWTMMYRSGNGTASIKDPIEPLNIANKKYVDDLVGITKTEYNYNFINGYSNKACDVKIYKQRNQLNIIVAGQLNINPDAFIQGKVQTIIEFTLDEETSRKLFVGNSNTAAGNIVTIPGTYYNDQNYQTTVVPFIIRRTTENGNKYWIRFTGSELTNASTITDVNIRLSLPLD